MPLPDVRSILFGVLAILFCGSERTHAQSVTLAWDPASGAAGYRLHSGTSSGVYTQTIDVGNVTTALVSKLAWEQTYFFGVTAYNSSGQSALSNQVAYTLVPAPVLLSATQSGSNSVKLTWSESDTNSGSFTILYGTSSGNYPNSLNVAGSPATVAGLTQGKTYYFVVRFLDNAAVNPSPISNQLSCVIPQPSPTPSPTVTPTLSPTSTPTPTPKSSPTPTPTPAPAPLAPTGLVLSMSSTQIVLFWIDNATNETSYLVQRSTDGVNFTLIATLAANSVSYVDTGLKSSTLYYYRVAASNASGRAFSDVASVTTLAGTPTPTPTPSPVPTAPSNLKAAVVSSSQIALAWFDNSTNESGFKIERSPNGTTFSQIAIVAANTTTYTSTGLTASTEYYYRVRAYNSGGDSSYSNSASATTAP